MWRCYHIEGQTLHELAIRFLFFNNSSKFTKYLLYLNSTHRRLTIFRLIHSLLITWENEEDRRKAGENKWERVWKIIEKCERIISVCVCVRLHWCVWERERERDSERKGGDGGTKRYSERKRENYELLVTEQAKDNYGYQFKVIFYISHQRFMICRLYLPYLVTGPHIHSDIFLLYYLSIELSSDYTMIVFMQSQDSKLLMWEGCGWGV